MYLLKKIEVIEAKELKQKVNFAEIHVNNNLYRETYTTNNQLTLKPINYDLFKLQDQYNDLQPKT